MSNSKHLKRGWLAGIILGMASAFVFVPVPRKPPPGEPRYRQSLRGSRWLHRHEHGTVGA